MATNIFPFYAARGNAHSQKSIHNADFVTKPNRLIKLIDFGFYNRFPSKQQEQQHAITP